MLVKVKLPGLALYYVYQAVRIQEAEKEVHFK